MRIALQDRVNGLSTGDQVYRALRDAIIAPSSRRASASRRTSWPSGSRVSRTPVREALIRLRDERFVQIVPQLGTFVTRISTAAVAGRRSSSASRSSAPPCASPRRAPTTATSPRSRARAPPGRGRRARRPRALRACSTTSSTPRSASSPGTPSPGRCAQRVKGHLNRVRRLSLPQPALPRGDGRRAPRTWSTALAAARPRRAPRRRCATTCGWSCSALPAIRAQHPDYFEEERR